MKVSCEIIKDLLPLYKDEICSDESKQIIEEHLLECTDCKRSLEQMNIDISVKEKEKNLREADAIKNLSKKWNKKLMLEILKGIGIGVLSVIIVIIFVYIFVGIKVG